MSHKKSSHQKNITAKKSYVGQGKVTEKNITAKKSQFSKEKYSMFTKEKWKIPIVMQCIIKCLVFYCCFFFVGGSYLEQQVIIIICTFNVILLLKDIILWHCFTDKFFQFSFYNVQTKCTVNTILFLFLILAEMKYNRKCTKCDNRTIGDEYHYIMECKHISNFKNRFINKNL